MLNKLVFNDRLTSHKATKHSNSWLRSDGGVDHVNLFVYAEQRLCGLTKFNSNTIITVRPNVMPNRSIFHSNEEDTTLGGRISMARETSGLSVDQVVKRLGVRAKTYEAWEADRSEPRANKLVALAGILNISPPYLLSGLGKQPSKLGLPERQIRHLTAQIEQLEQNLKTAAVSLRQIKSALSKMK